MIDCYEYSGPLGKEIPFDDIRKIQMGILDAIVAVCEEHGLRYYLSGGTLLGAVRHKGYIPWDDDMDINMPRPDCDRLLEITGGKIGDNYEIGSFDGPISHCMPFIRAYDTDYLLRIESSKGAARAYSNVSIDIFPIDGLPKSEKVSRIHYFIAKCLITFRQIAYYRELTGNWDWHRIVRAISVIPAKMVGWRRWNAMIQKISRRYGYEESAEVGVVCCGVHTNTERLPRECYGEASYVEFEGKTYRAPHDWQRYLTQIYGDYMKLPPESSRVRRHHYTVYSMKEAGK